jgi:hypothetical protein
VVGRMRPAPIACLLALTALAAAPAAAAAVGPAEKGGPTAHGETLHVLPDSGPDSRLVRHLDRGQHVFSDGGGVVSLRTLTDIVTACTAWGSERCP